MSKGKTHRTPIHALTGLVGNVVQLLFWLIVLVIAIVGGSRWLWAGFKSLQ